MVEHTELACGLEASINSEHLVILLQYDGGLEYMLLLNGTCPPASAIVEVTIEEATFWLGQVQRAYCILHS